MNKYPIKECFKDFDFDNSEKVTKGTRRKRIVVDNKKRIAMFKYKKENAITSELCSEKMCYEIAKILNYDCAKIEFAKDENGELGILNYIFINEKAGEELIDISFYLNIYEQNREKIYTISNIKKILDSIDKKLFESFIRLMIFDALVGEQDRHEDNWGIIKRNNNYSFAPLYDNGDNLLQEFFDDCFAKKYYLKTKDFDAYIKRSKALLYKENKVEKYRHFELIQYLYNLYPKVVQREVKNLKKLTKSRIKNIVNAIPDALLTDKHKEYIIIYLEKRKKIMLEIINGVN